MKPTPHPTASLGACFLVAAVIAGCQSSGDTKSGSAGDATRGAQPFAVVCATCHGPDGHGVKGLGKDLVSNAYVKKASDDDLVTLIVNGRDAKDPLNSTGIAMPPKGGNAALSDKDVRDIVAYLRTINKP